MIRSEAVDIYTLFKKRPGSGNIAKPTAIDVVMDICKREKPKRVLELGGGIGTVTYTVLKHSNAYIDVYEQNDFCTHQMRKNLKKFEARYSIIESYLILPPTRKYELVIIDGGEAKDHTNGYAETVWLFLSYLDFVNVIYIEGNRNEQRKQVRRALHSKGIFRPIRHKSAIYGGKRFLSGHEVRFKKNTSITFCWLNYLWWEFVLWVHGILQRFLALFRRK